MSFKTRIALLSATSVLSVSAIAGFGTYAMFTAHTQTSSHSITAGTLKISAERDDISQSGPMFYTSSASPQAGVIPTGLWAPGDMHTRGLFLENNGTLSGRLATLSATPADANGNPLTGKSIDSTDYSNDMTFANQAVVTIWKLQAYDPVMGETCEYSGNNATALEKVVDLVNAEYQYFKDHGVSFPGQDALTYVNNGLLKSIDNITAKTSSGQTINDGSVQVVNIIQEPLVDFVNGQVNLSNIPGFSDVVAPDESSLLAFTVGLDRTAPQGQDGNAMQSKSVYFNFGTTWTQNKNNP